MNPASQISGQIYTFPKTLLSFYHKKKFKKLTKSKITITKYQYYVPTYKVRFTINLILVMNKKYPTILRPNIFKLILISTKNNV